MRLAAIRDESAPVSATGRPFGGAQDRRWRLRGGAPSGGERLAISGDCDVDGVTSCAILVEGLSALGANAVAYIPDRFREGYGVNCGALDRLRAEGAGLVLTADCGTRSIAGGAHPRGRGRAGVVRDHTA